jgi:hypothetical protein
MLIVMDMSTGQRLEQSAGYNEEALNTHWIPRPELQLGLQSAIETRPRRRYEEPRDINAFLNNLYLRQE